MTVLVVGGGWAGCAAAVAAARAGAAVTLCERTDMLLGTGLVGGIFRNNARFTVAEEMKALGAGTLFDRMDENARHVNVNFPGHRHASLYDISRTPAAVQRCLEQMGVTIRTQTRLSEAAADGGVLRAVRAGRNPWLEADVFIDCTGSAGPAANCATYGNGCAMCVLRCPSFGGRVSLCGMAGVRELQAINQNGRPGAMSGSCKLHRDSLSPALAQQLERFGVAVVPVPDTLREDHLGIKACQQYAITDYVENLVLLDTGHAKLMVPYFELERLRKIPGFENARYEDPYAGGRGNSVRLLSIAPHDETLRVTGFENLFCAGEKAGPLVGHTEAVITGTVAGINAVFRHDGHPPLLLPRLLAVGEGLAWIAEQMASPEGLGYKYTFSGSVLFEHVKAAGLYSVEPAVIKARVHSAGLSGVLGDIQALRAYCKAHSSNPG